MPIVAHNDLPTFARLREEGWFIPESHVALHQDIRELHVGLLNMMPDKALAATERQFFRLVAGANSIAQFYVHPFSLPQLKRGDEARAHIDRYYETFEQIRDQGLDSLIITGANVTHANLAEEPFWEPLIEVIDWAAENVTSTLCSCLATHAVLQFRYGQKRVTQPEKIWGVYRHRVMDRHHPLVNDVNTLIDIPHSRWNDISRAQFDVGGLRVLVESDKAGVHLATSPDGLRFVFFQGHPEYDTVSLLKEYKREVMAYVGGGRKDYPPFPRRMLYRQGKAILDEYRERLEQAMAADEKPPEFPERFIHDQMDNTWRDTAAAVVGNWMGLVYRVTNKDRKIPFMPGVDPNDPLGLN